jgi:plastocyanin
MTSRLLICSSVLWVAALLPGASLTGRVQIAAATAGRSFEGVAVWLMPVQGKAPAPAAQTHRVLQKNKRFSPHVSVISVGSTVDWPNLDPIFHNAFSNFAGQPFDTGLYPPGGTQRTRFQREGWSACSATSTRR